MCIRDRIISVDVGENLSSQNPTNFLGIAKRGLEISYRVLSEYTVKDSDVLIQMDFFDVGVFNDQANREVYEHGQSWARAKIPEIERKIRNRFDPPSHTVIKNIAP